MKKLKITGAVILLLAGLMMIFNEQIKCVIVDWMTNSSLKQPVKDDDSKGNFDFEKVKAVDNKMVAKAAFSKNQDAIGKLSVPSVKVKLPIFKGLDNYNLVRGAGTMKEAEQMGTGNYALAGHHMKDGSLLFGPLENVKKGDKIYLADKHHVYVYETRLKTVVDKHDTNYINDVQGQKLVTLITCASGMTGESRRVVVQGELLCKKPANKENLKVFNK
ncbi:class A sortase [Ligilactobacillus ruminis]|uniref:class A sortase n=1 Tax=Ligilactobacillus ruminis TaxID=1623 RepID=UPI0022E66EBA|nr:class A sortase [Ligilactobacillus ruminis]